MEAKIFETGQMTLLGFGFFGDPFSLSGAWSEQNEIGRLWNRFMAYLTEHHHQIEHITGDRVMYEVHISHEETGVTGEHEVFVGLEVDDLEEVPVELLVKVLPAVTYAVFTLRGTQIISDWTQMVLTDWMPGSGYEMAHQYSIQRYDERFKGVDHIEESVLDVYVPVKR